MVPFAATHVLGQVHQNNVLTATRGSELFGRSDDGAGPARRAASAVAGATDGLPCVCARCIAAPACSRPKGLLPHFRLFALLTADRSGDGLAELHRHLGLSAALRTLSQEGFVLHSVEVDLADTEHGGAPAGPASIGSASGARSEPRCLATPMPPSPASVVPAAWLFGHHPRRDAGLPAHHRERLTSLDAEVRAPLASEFPEVTVRFDLSRTGGLGYYAGPCVRITAVDATGLRLPLVDSGYTDWMARLLSDRRSACCPPASAPICWRCASARPARGCRSAD